MADRPFRNPLLAKLDETSHYTIRSAWEGLEYLLRYWRGDKNTSYRLAVHLCRDAIDGWAPPERAREALRRALDAASLSIPNSRQSPPKLRASIAHCGREPVARNVSDFEAEECFVVEQALGDDPRPHLPRRRAEASLREPF